MGTCLLLCGSALFLCAFCIYNWGVITGKHLPAFAAWGLFSLITLVNCVLNFSLMGKWLNIVVLATDCVVCIGTSIAILIRLKGKVALDRRDKQTVMLSLVAIAVWVVFHNAWVGNLLNQGAYTITFWPTYRNVLKDPRNEPTIPWAIWSVAFVLNVVALWLQPTTQWMDYVSPSVCLVHHAAISLLSLRRPAPAAATMGRS